MDTKFYNFINLYNLLLLNLSKKERNYTIAFYYLNNEFNIEIEDYLTKQLVFKYNFECNKHEYDYLINLIGQEFILNHKITLPYFDDISFQDANKYYKSKDSLKNTLDYNKAKVHKLRNSLFELRFHYFEGLNELSYKMQDMALEKLKEKVYKKQTI